MSGLTYIGPLGNLMEVKCPAPGIPTGRPRSSSVRSTLGGKAKVQQGALQHRPMAWAIPHAQPSDVDNLNGLWHGTFGPPPFYWYEPAAAVVNMLPPESASPYAVDGLAGWELFSGAGPLADGGSLTLPDGSVHAHSLSVPTVATFAIGPIMPFLPGRTYGAWGVASTSASRAVTIFLAYCDASGAPLLSGGYGTVVSTASGVRSWATTLTGTPPATSAGLRLLVNTPADSLVTTLAALRVAETDSALTEWHPGRGLPRVAILDVPETLQQAYGETRSDYTVALQEV